MNASLPPLQNYFGQRNKARVFMDEYYNAPNSQSSPPGVAAPIPCLSLQILLPKHPQSRPQGHAYPQGQQGDSTHDTP